MANAAGDAHEFPVYGAHFRVTFPILDNTGSTVSGAAGLDSEVSKDSGSFADCTNEATEIGSTGIYYLDITGAEMTGKAITVQVKTSTSNAKTTVITLYPTRLAVVGTADQTAQAGAGSAITLAASTFTADAAMNGLYVLITNNSPSGAQYQLRKIISGVASTQVVTVDSAWGTNPSSASTYSILSPVSVNIGAVGNALAGAISSVDGVSIDAFLKAVLAFMVGKVIGTTQLPYKAQDGTTTALTQKGVDVDTGLRSTTGTIP